MVERLAQILSAAAGAHVEAVRDETGVEQHPRPCCGYSRQSPSPSRPCSRTTSPAGLTAGALRLYQNLCILIRTDQAVSIGKREKS